MSPGKNEDEHEDEDKDEDADKNDDEDENQNEDENGDVRFLTTGRVALQRKRFGWPRLRAVRGHAQYQRLLRLQNSIWAAGRPTTVCALSGIPCYYGGASV